MKKTSLIITIDTEFSTHKDDIGIFGRIKDKEYGVPKLLELLEKYNCKGTFFVDVYTKKTDYIKSLKDICKELINKGHDIQLHTHPDGIFDPKRGAVKDYTLNEQVDIIKRGKDIFYSWFGKLPEAHRAGDWGANEDTLKALLANEIFIDSSMFFGWQNCELNKIDLTRNKLCEYKNLLEVPASIFKCVGLKMFKPYRLLSTDGNPVNETFKVTKMLAENNIKVVTTVYHSFSFLKWNKERTEYAVAKNRIKKFDSFLNKVSSSNVFEFKTIKGIKDLYSNNKKEMTQNQDYIAETGLIDTLFRIPDRFVK